MPTDTKTGMEPDSVEWTDERFDRSIGFNELPEQLRNRLSAVQETAKKKRGPQKTPTKQPVTIRMSADVLDVLRATGPGWQARADQALREHFVTSRQTAGEANIGVKIPARRIAGKLGS